MINGSGFILVPIKRSSSFCQSGKLKKEIVVLLPIWQCDALYLISSAFSKALKELQIPMELYKRFIVFDQSEEAIQ